MGVLAEILALPGQTIPERRKWILGHPVLGSLIFTIAMALTFAVPMGLLLFRPARQILIGTVIGFAAAFPVGWWTLRQTARAERRKRV